MLLLLETPAGFAIFKVKASENVLEKADLYKDFQSLDKAKKIVELNHFEPFLDTTDALASTTACVDGKLTKTLKRCVKTALRQNEDIHNQLLVTDAKLGNAIKSKFDVDCVSSNAVQELMKCVRQQGEGLLENIARTSTSAMSLGLAHSLCRYKLKFTPEKLDILIVESSKLLENIVEEFNKNVMRIREWFGWHFPEMGKIVADHVAYIKCVKKMGMKEAAAETDLSDILPENLEEQVKAAAEISVGVEMAEEDVSTISTFCDEIINFNAYREQLTDYINVRMMALAPNIAVLLNPILGARLLAQAGSLSELSKQPASTIQILGAEKALFRALKTKKSTPKYGLIYHAPLVAKASSFNKGKAARMLANKLAIAARYDSFHEDIGIELGAEHKAKLEARLRILEDDANQFNRFKRANQVHNTSSKVKFYEEADQSELVAVSTKRKREELDTSSNGVKNESQDGEIAGPSCKKEEDAPLKKMKKKIKKQLIEEIKVKTEVKEEPAVESPVEGVSKKKKKKKHQEEEEEVNTVEQTAQEEAAPKKKKKKKNKKQNVDD